MIGSTQSTRRVLGREAWESRRTVQASQDGNREFISLLACISATGIAITPTLIYKGTSYDLQDTWVQEFGEKDDAFFAASDNGWSSNALGLQWLTKVFHTRTKQKANNRRRLLIVDGHSSHVNMKFLDLADSLRTIVLILPPHSTHRLQPLDVGLFAPLAKAYSKELNTLMHHSLGLVDMTKRGFWLMFHTAWKQSFTEENIKSAFEATGIFPYEPERVLKSIRRPPTNETPSKRSFRDVATPITSRAVRKLQAAYRTSPTRDKLDLILHANVKLAAQHSVDQHMHKGLTDALKGEKQRRTRGKRLDLLGEEDVGPQLFSPGRIQAAKDYQEGKEVAAEQEKVEKAERKAEATIARQQKEQEKQERALQRQAVKQLKVEERERVRTEKAMSKGQKGKAIPKTKGQSITLATQNSVATSESSVIAQENEEVRKVTTRGRAVKPPQRFIK